MRHPDARRAFIIGRARVRQILAGYVAQPPGELDVVTRVDDRPVLAGAPAWFDFSFSRCEGLHACAVTRGRRVGIDVEAFAIGPLSGEGSAALEASARDTDLLSPEDLVWLSVQPPDRRAACRAEVLTKKEALAKAIGGGPMPLSGFVVPRDGDGPVTVARHRPGPWLVRSFSPAPGIAGAIAAEGEWRLTLLHYPS
ncbi:MAG: hypothetical protein FJW27_18290 [Acidimicrobiia bacterium]|nr:hypothetical protein [Acidimicrobiia bacterium]